MKLEIETETEYDEKYKTKTEVEIQINPLEKKNNKYIWFLYFMGIHLHLLFYSQKLAERRYTLIRTVLVFFIYLCYNGLLSTKFQDSKFQEVPCRF